MLSLASSLLSIFSAQKRRAERILGQYGLIPAQAPTPEFVITITNRNQTAAKPPSHSEMLESSSVQVPWIRPNEWGGGFNERGRAAVSRYL